MTHQHETSRETDKKGNDKGGNVRFKRNETQMQDLLVQNIIISQKIY
jgi:hypothetical protein